jgi:hypothetical protein
MDGVYSTPPLPDDFDLKTAGDADLWQTGLLLQRGMSGKHPAIATAWNKVSERGLRIILPNLEPMPDSARRLGAGRDSARVDYK